MMRGALSVALALACGVHAAPASAGAEADAEDRVHAPSPGADGVYGRLDGSVDLGLALGAELEAGEPRAAVRISGHYFWTAGGYARYSDGFGTTDERPSRTLSLGIDLRPLFLPRFALDLEQGPALLDLTLDSLSLSAGAYLAQPVSRSFADERGFELGLGFGVPVLADADGPWLEARAERRFADRGESAWLFTLSLAYRSVILSTEEPR